VKSATAICRAGLSLTLFDTNSGCYGQRKGPKLQRVMSRVRTAVDALQLAKIQPVINGTGIVIHTNFGRAPLGPALIESLTTIGPGYTNLEYDLTSGERGHRATYLEHNLALLCEAEATTVVNNCAAALILLLRHFTAKKKEVVISRGELIQIGGGFASQKFSKPVARNCAKSVPRTKLRLKITPAPSGPIPP